jgi:hypothetical protein
MRLYRSWKRALASLVVVASLAAACGGQSGSSNGAAASRGPTPIPTPETLSAYPTDFPTTYTNDQDPPDPGLEPVAGGLKGHRTGTLRAADGTTGTYTSTWVENRVAAAAVTCGAVKYTNVFIGETPEVTSEVDFTDWGKAVLVTVGHIVVYKSSRNGSSPSVCEQSTVGTFSIEFSKGPTKGLMTGTWHFDATGLLVFDPPPAVSPSPSQGSG